MVPQMFPLLWLPLLISSFTAILIILACLHQISTKPTHKTTSPHLILNSMHWKW